MSIFDIFLRASQAQEAQNAFSRARGLNLPPQQAAGWIPTKADMDAERVKSEEEKTKALQKQLEALASERQRKKESDLSLQAHRATQAEETKRHHLAQEEAQRQQEARLKEQQGALDYHRDLQRQLRRELESQKAHEKAQREVEEEKDKKRAISNSPGNSKLWAEINLDANRFNQLRKIFTPGNLPQEMKDPEDGLILSTVLEKIYREEDPHGVLDQIRLVLGKGKIAEEEHKDAEKEWEANEKDREKDEEEVREGFQSHQNKQRKKRKNDFLAMVAVMEGVANERVWEIPDKEQKPKDILRKDPKYPWAKKIIEETDGGLVRRSNWKDILEEYLQDLHPLHPNINEYIDWRYRDDSVLRKKYLDAIGGSKPKPKPISTPLSYNIKKDAASQEVATLPPFSQGSRTSSDNRGVSSVPFPTSAPPAGGSPPPITPMPPSLPDVIPLEADADILPNLDEQAEFDFGAPEMVGAGTPEDPSILEDPEIADRILIDLWLRNDMGLSREAAQEVAYDPEAQLSDLMGMKEQGPSLQFSIDQPDLDAYLKSHHPVAYDERVFHWLDEQGVPAETWEGIKGGAGGVAWKITTDLYDQRDEKGLNAYLHELFKDDKIALNKQDWLKNRRESIIVSSKSGRDFIKKVDEAVGEDTEARNNIIEGFISQADKLAPRLTVGMPSGPKEYTELGYDYPADPLLDRNLTVGEIANGLWDARQNLIESDRKEQLQKIADIYKWGETLSKDGSEVFLALFNGLAHGFWQGTKNVMVDFLRPLLAGGSIEHFPDSSLIPIDFANPTQQFHLVKSILASARKNRQESGLLDKILDMDFAGIKQEHILPVGAALSFMEQIEETPNLFGLLALIDVPSGVVWDVGDNRPEEENLGAWVLRDIATEYLMAPLFFPFALSPIRKGVKYIQGLFKKGINKLKKGGNAQEILKDLNSVAQELKVLREVTSQSGYDEASDLINSHIEAGGITIEGQRIKTREEFVEFINKARAREAEAQARRLQEEAAEEISEETLARKAAEEVEAVEEPPGPQLAEPFKKKRPQDLTLEPPSLLEAMGTPIDPITRAYMHIKKYHFTSLPLDDKGTRLFSHSGRERLGGPTITSLEMYKSLVSDAHVRDVGPRADLAALEKTLSASDLEKAQDFERAVIAREIEHGFHYLGPPESINDIFDELIYRGLASPGESRDVLSAKKRSEEFVREREAIRLNILQPFVEGNIQAASKFKNVPLKEARRIYKEFRVGMEDFSKSEKDAIKLYKEVIKREIDRTALLVRQGLPRNAVHRLKEKHILYAKLRDLDVKLQSPLLTSSPEDLLLFRERSVAREILERKFEARFWELVNFAHESWRLDDTVKAFYPEGNIPSAHKATLEVTKIRQEQLQKEVNKLRDEVIKAGGTLQYRGVVSGTTLWVYEGDVLRPADFWGGSSFPPNYDSERVFSFLEENFKDEIADVLHKLDRDISEVFSQGHLLAHVEGYSPKSMLRGLDYSEEVLWYLGTGGYIGGGPSQVRGSIPALTRKGREFLETVRTPEWLANKLKEEQAFIKQKYGYEPRTIPNRGSELHVSKLAANDVEAGIVLRYLEETGHTFLGKIDDPKLGELWEFAVKLEGKEYSNQAYPVQVLADIIHKAPEGFPVWSKESFERYARMRALELDEVSEGKPFSDLDLKETQKRMDKLEPIYDDAATIIDEGLEVDPDLRKRIEILAEEEGITKLDPTTGVKEGHKVPTQTDEDLARRVARDEVWWRIEDVEPGYKAQGIPELPGNKAKDTLKDMLEAEKRGVDYTSASAKKRGVEVPLRIMEKQGLVRSTEIPTTMVHKATLTTPEQFRIHRIKKGSSIDVLKPGGIEYSQEVGESYKIWRLTKRGQEVARELMKESAGARLLRESKGLPPAPGTLMIFPMFMKTKMGKALEEIVYRIAKKFRRDTPEIISPVTVPSKFSDKFRKTRKIQKQQEELLRTGTVDGVNKVLGDLDSHQIVEGLQIIQKRDLPLTSDAFRGKTPQEAMDKLAKAMLHFGGTVRIKEGVKLTVRNMPPHLKGVAKEINSVLKAQRALKGGPIMELPGPKGRYKRKKDALKYKTTAKYIGKKLLEPLKDTYGFNGAKRSAARLWWFAEGSKGTYTGIAKHRKIAKEFLGVKDKQTIAENTLKIRRQWNLITKMTNYMKGGRFDWAKKVMVDELGVAPKEADSYFKGFAGVAPVGLALATMPNGDERFDLADWFGQEWESYSGFSKGVILTIAGAAAVAKLSRGFRKILLKRGIGTPEHDFIKEIYNDLDLKMFKSLSPEDRIKHIQLRLAVDKMPEVSEFSKARMMDDLLKKNFDDLDPEMAEALELTLSKTYIPFSPPSAVVPYFEKILTREATKSAMVARDLRTYAMEALKDIPEEELDWIIDYVASNPNLRNRRRALNKMRRAKDKAGNLLYPNWSEKHDRAAFILDMITRKARHGVASADNKGINTIIQSYHKKWKKRHQHHNRNIAPAVDVISHLINGGLFKRYFSDLLDNIESLATKETWKTETGMFRNPLPGKWFDSGRRPKGGLVKPALTAIESVERVPMAILSRLRKDEKTHRAFQKRRYIKNWIQGLQGKRDPATAIESLLQSGVIHSMLGFRPKTGLINISQALWAPGATSGKAFLKVFYEWITGKKPLFDTKLAKRMNLTQEWQDLAMLTDDDKLITRKVQTAFSKASLSFINATENLIIRPFTARLFEAQAEILGLKGVDKFNHMLGSYKTTFQYGRIDTSPLLSNNMVGRFFNVLSSYPIKMTSLGNLWAFKTLKDVRQFKRFAYTLGGVYAFHQFMAGLHIDVSEVFEEGFGARTLSNLGLRPILKYMGIELPDWKGRGIAPLPPIPEMYFKAAELDLSTEKGQSQLIALLGNAAPMFKAIGDFWRSTGDSLGGYSWMSPRIITKERARGLARYIAKAFAVSFDNIDIKEDPRVDAIVDLGTQLREQFGFQTQRLIDSAAFMEKMDRINNDNITSKYNWWSHPLGKELRRLPAFKGAKNIENLQWIAQNVYGDRIEELIVDTFHIAASPPLTAEEQRAHQPRVFRTYHNLPADVKALVAPEMYKIALWYADPKRKLTKDNLARLNATMLRGKEARAIKLAQTKEKRLLLPQISWNFLSYSIEELNEEYDSIVNEFYRNRGKEGLKDP